MSYVEKRKYGNEKEATLSDKNIRMSYKEWNHAWDKGELVPGPPCKGFLMVGQVFKGEVTYKGKVYIATAWQLMHDPVCVDLTLKEDNATQKGSNEASTQTKADSSSQA